MGAVLVWTAVFDFTLLCCMLKMEIIDVLSTPQQHLSATKNKMNCLLVLVDLFSNSPSITF